MSKRPYVAPNVVLSAGDMSTTLHSTATIVQQLSEGSYFFKWTGTSPVGNVNFEISSDYALNSGGGVLTAGTWNAVLVDYLGDQVTNVPVSGNTGNGIIDVIQSGGFAFRATYVPTSGTGSLTITYNGKVA